MKQSEQIFCQLFNPFSYKPWFMTSAIVVKYTIHIIDFFLVLFRTSLYYLLFLVKLHNHYQEFLLYLQSIRIFVIAKNIFQHKSTSCILRIILHYLWTSFIQTGGMFYKVGLCLQILVLALCIFLSKKTKVVQIIVAISYSNCPKSKR